MIKTEKAALDEISNHDTLERILDEKMEPESKDFVTLHQTQNKTQTKNETEHRSMEQSQIENSDLISNATEDRVFNLNFDH